MSSKQKSAQGGQAKIKNKAWIVAVDMGYGHQRAAHPLRDLDHQEVINAFAMLVHLVLTYFLNRRELDKVFRPVWYRKAIIWLEIAFFAVFSAIVFWDKVIR